MMLNQNTPISRRRFLATSAAAAGAMALGRAGLAEPAGAADDVHFFVIGDTHFLADKNNPTKLDPGSAGVTSALIDTLNRLPGTKIPDDAGGGNVGAPKGLIHAGDLID